MAALAQALHHEPVGEAPRRATPQQVSVLDRVVLGLRAADAGDRVRSPEFGGRGQVADYAGHLVRADGVEEEGEEHLDGADRVEALGVLVVFVAGDEAAGIGTVEGREDAGFGVALVCVAFGCERLVVDACEVAEDAPAGGVHAVHSDVLHFEPVYRAYGRGGARQDGGLVPRVAPAVGERELDQLRVDARPGGAGAAPGADAERRVVGRRQVEAGFPGVEDRDDARVVEVARRFPPVEVLDQWGDEFFEEVYIASRFVD